jgi:hypothetical protein
MARSITRWQKMEERRNTVRAIWLILLTFLIIGAALFFGFKVLTKIFIFMGNISSMDKPAEKTDFIPPSPPRFLTRLEATNSASLSLKGISEAGASVFLTLNQNPAGDTVALDDGSFEFTHLQLSEGQNTFSAVAIDTAGNRSQISSSLSVRYSSKSPILVINSPLDKQSFSGNESRITISGSVDPDTRLTINDRVVILSAGGKFSYQLGLNSGENLLSIMAVDSFGNRTKKEITVSYHP